MLPPSAVAYLKIVFGLAGLQPLSDVDLEQWYPNYGPRAKPSPPSHFIRPAKPFLNIKKIFCLPKICWFRRTVQCNIFRNNHIT